MGQVVYVGLFLLGCLILGSISSPVAVTNSSQVAPRSSCPHGAFYFRHCCYYYVPNSVPWYDAEFHCQNLGEDCHLVSFSSPREEKLISAYIRSRSSNTNSVWIGFNALGHYNVQLVWEWSDGLPYISGSRLWDNRSPSTSLSSSECLVLYNIRNPSSSTRWLQVNCENSYPFVCKCKARN